MKTWIDFFALIRRLAQLAILYVGALVLGLILFSAGFKIGLLHTMGMLFFRGLLLAALTFVLLFALLAAIVPRCPGWLDIRDAFCAAILSVSFNICFLVVVPVTVDRSVSVFILGEMANAPNETYSPEDMSALFVKIYVDDYQQIARRLGEQALIGNIEEVQGRYRISARGYRFIEICKLVSWLFDGDPRFVSPRPGSAGNQNSSPSADTISH
jgi:hypothetical protein